jgi:hypothetical protein
MTEEPTVKYRELQLKEHLSPIVYKCLAKFYKTGKYGYLSVIGGEAVNAYLVGKDKVSTNDFDVKFVVNPEFTKTEEDLMRANAMRLRVTRGIYECLQQMEPPKGFKLIYPKLCIKMHPNTHLIYLDEGRMFYVDKLTGEEKFTHYNTNKTFKIILYYQYEDEPLAQFDLMDIGLFYPKKLAYHYFEDQERLYDTFLKAPFNKTVPIPFIVKNDVRIPTMMFVLYDTFRMILIAMDMTNIFKDSPEELARWRDKIPRTWDKLNKILAVLTKINDSALMKELAEAINKTTKLYEPLAYYNMFCHKNDKNVYEKAILEEKKKSPDCAKIYVDRVNEFLEQLSKTEQLMAKLKDN